MIPLSETVRSTGPGRPRDPGVNEKILKAALRQLAHDGYARMEDGPTPSTGSASSDLRTVLTTLQETLYQTNGMAIIGAVLVEQSHTPDLITFFRKRIVRPRRMKLRQVLEEAEKRGELRPKADIDAAVNMLIGSFYAYYLTSEKMPQAWARRIVDTVWKGIAKTPQRRRITRH